MYYQTTYHSPIGLLTLAATKNTLVGLWIEGQKYFAAGYSQLTPCSEPLPVFCEVNTWLDDYFAGKQPDPNTLPIAPRGSCFQQQVWRQLLQIPYGKTVTYGDIARAVGCRSAQAVGGAVSRNPISIIIPCHRVLGRNGSLTGYAGGEERKRWLLQQEGIIL